MKPPPALPRLDGPAAIPRKNGEIVFSAPWQSRAFGIAVALAEQKLFPWSELQQRLIDAVAATPVAEGEDATEAYYAQWLSALEQVLAARGIVTSSP